MLSFAVHLSTTRRAVHLVARNAGTVFDCVTACGTVACAAWTFAATAWHASLSVVIGHDYSLLCGFSTSGIEAGLNGN